MKKFFSLVLALVMALSLTTVAWGAAQDDLDAVAAGGGTVTLTADCAQLKLNCNIGTRTGGTGTDADPYLVSRAIDALKITGNVKVDGFAVETGYHVVYASPTYYITQSYDIGTLTFSGMTFTNKAYITNEGNLDIDSLVFENVTFDMTGKTTDAAAHIISTDGGIEKVSFINCKFLNCSDIKKPIAIDCRSTDDIDITITGCKFDGAAANAIQIGGAGSNFTGDIEISDNEISDTADRAIRISYVGAGATLTVVDNKVDNCNVVEGEAMKTSSIDSSVTTKFWNNDWDGGAVVSDDANAAKLQDIGSGVTTDANGNITGGVFTTAPSSVAAGYTVATDVNGNLVVIAGTNAPASGAKGAYYTTDLTNLAVYPSCDLTNYNYTLEPYTVAADAAKTFAKVAIWQTHKVTGAKTIVYTAVVASADSANLAFVNGASITYLNTNVSTWTGTATAVATVDVEDAEKCGDVFIAGDVGVYKDGNGKVYYEDITGAAYNVGGQLVLLKAATEAYPVVDSTALKAALAAPAAGTVYTVAHDYDCDYKTYLGKKTVTKVYCAECDAEFAFVAGKMSDAIAKFGAGNYLPTTLADAAGTVYVSIAPVGGTVVTPSTDKVQSAETFDAGIAMYVGMSVMAAAGSVVVLKKKD